MDLTLPLLTTTLTFIQGLLPQITSNATVKLIIDILVKMVPLAINAYQTLLPTIENIIMVLNQTDDVTDDQFATLKQMSDAIALHYQATAAAAKAADAAYALSQKAAA